MKNIQRKTTAFTLIELLVVIVIIGILATISTATFSNYIKKANNIKMLAELSNYEDAFLSDSLVREADSDPIAYFYGVHSASAVPQNAFVPGALLGVLRKAGFDVPASDSILNLRSVFSPYMSDGDVFVFGSGGNSQSSFEDNDFAIVGWGEGLSTFDLSSSGPIVIGTKRMKDAIEANLSDLESPDEMNSNLLRVLHRYLCQPDFLYGIIISGGYVATFGANDSAYLNGGGFSNNPNCPY